MSGSAKAGTTAERHTCELQVLAGSAVRAPPKARVRRIFSPLTRDLHGRRQNIVLESRLRVGFFYRKTGERAAERNVCSEDRTAGCGNTLVFRDDLFSSQTTRSCSASALTGLALLQTF